MRDTVCDLLTLLVLSSFAIACQPRSQPATEMRAGEYIEELVVMADDEGFESLFNGTLERWRGYRSDKIPSGWSVADGVIACSGANAGDLITKEQFQNFDLRLEWKIPRAGNSGIMYRVLETGDHPYTTGPEYQILDEGHSDPILSGAAYDVYRPQRNVAKPAGEWNVTRILMDGPHVEHWLNGEPVVEYELFSDDWEARVAKSKWAGNAEYGRMKRGHIALQDHGDQVWFRNVRIRRLPDSEF